MRYLLGMWRFRTNRHYCAVRKDDKHYGQAEKCEAQRQEKQRTANSIIVAHC